MNTAEIRKATTALVTSVIVWGGAVVVSPSGPITSAEWVELAGAAAVALGVWAVPNAIRGVPGA